MSYFYTKTGEKIQGILSAENIKLQEKKMAYKNQFYEDNKLDFYSQNGEDGVIREILRILNVFKIKKPQSFCG